MSNKRKLNIQIPLRGLDRRLAYRQQSPYGSPDLLNFRPFATIEGRERGGSRPGVDLSHRNRLGTGPVRMLESMDISFTDGFTSWCDTFNGLSLASLWSIASWESAAPGVLVSMMAYVDDTISVGAAVRTALSIDSSSAYSIDLYLAPSEGSYHGKFQIFARMDNTTPDATDEGITAEIVMEDDTGAYTGTLTATVGGSDTVYNFTAGNDGEPLSGWFTVLITANNVKCYWRDALLVNQDVAAMTGLRVGFGMECTQAGGLSLVDAFRVQYYEDTDAPAIRSVLIGSANGDIYREVFRGTMEVVSSNLSVRDDKYLVAAQHGQKLYIADYGLRVTGTDGTLAGTSLDATGVSDWTAENIDVYSDVVVITSVQGSAIAGTYEIDSLAAGALTLKTTAGSGACTYRVERGPKVYDPIANTLTLMVATAGQMPTSNPVVARCWDRIEFSGGDLAPHAFFLSKKTDPLDWDYAASGADAAQYGPTSAAGVPGKPIVATLAHSDDYLVFLCIGETWIMRGDPGSGGSLDRLSHTVGAVGRNAWCFGPSGEIVFMSRDGVYLIAPGASSYPQPISRELLPQELMNINSDTTEVQMEYDVRDRGVHIYLTPESSNERIHWWMDWDNKSFWPVVMDGDHEPTAICRYVSAAVEDTSVILGCRDGWLRRYSPLNDTDSGKAIESYLVCLLPLGNDVNEGKVMEMVAVMADDSGSVDWSIVARGSYEETLNALTGTADNTGIWTEGENYSVRPDAVRGMAFALKIEGKGYRWAIERLTAIVRMVGKRKML